MVKRGLSLQGLVFRLILSVGLALSGLTGLLLPRLRHPWAMDLLRSWRAAAPSLDPACLGGQAAALAPPLLRHQFQVDLVCGALVFLGLFLMLYYRRRLTPLLRRLEALGLGVW